MLQCSGVPSTAVCVCVCVCVVCRAAASEGGDHEDAGPDSAAGTSAQQQVGEGEVKHPSQPHVKP